MLQYLGIKNLALLEAAALEFDGGFTVVTGETGAGKSVLLGALSLLSGARTDKTKIRKGQDALEVEATLFFDDTGRVDAFLSEAGLPLCSEGHLIIRRVVSHKYGSRIHVNGSLATLTHLQSLGELWVDFHGPGEPQKLFHERHQLAMLDAYAKLQDALLLYQKDYNAWRALLKRMDELSKSSQLSLDEAAFIQSQIDSIEALDISDEKIQALERDFSRVHNAQEMAAVSGILADGIAGDVGALQKVRDLMKPAADFSGMDAELGGPLYERMEALVVELEDISQEYGHAGAGLDMTDEAISEVTEKMHLWLDLKRKYGPSVSQVQEKHRELKERLEMQSDVQASLLKLKDEASTLEALLVKHAGVLYEKRKEVSRDLSRKVVKLLKKLGFKSPRLEAKIVRDSAFTEHGDSSCQLLFAPNPGQDLLPLNKIASSGETARVMLALKAILAASDKTPLLVFDEVDANVGGEIGREVGEELKRLAGKHQVFCVTHLPQVAAKGDRHWVVSKQQTRLDTFVELHAIHEDGDARMVELARMLGDRASSSAKEHARVLLSV